MPDGSTLKLLDHQLTSDEMSWVRGIYEDFRTERESFSGPAGAFDPKETLREILGREQHRLPVPIDLTGDGVWRGGRNAQGRLVACVFLKHVELHRHPYSRTDQFPIYVIGEADAFFEDSASHPVVTRVSGGGHFHNAPGAPHAFLPKIGAPINDDWEIAFIAITPRNLREDTHPVLEATRAGYQRIVGREAPTRV